MYASRISKWIFGSGLALLAITCLLGFATVSSADPRIEEECHVPINANNTDLEVKFPNCEGNILSADDVVAFGQFMKTVKVEPPAHMFPLHNLYQIKGQASTTPGLDDYQIAAGSACTLVTRNWDNANQQYNYTEFTTNDWYLQVKVEPTDDGFERKYTLMCFNATQ